MARMRDVPARAGPRSKSSDLHSVRSSSSAFGSSKKDKRHIKHSTLIAKITKDNSKKPRQRRPNKKLVATLDSLADALPDVEDEADAGVANGQVNIIRHKSIKTRPGAMKRKEKLEKGERDRFTKNLAEMSRPAPEVVTPTAAPTANPTSNRWQALRTFISGTLDRLPEQEAKKE